MKKIACCLTFLIGTLTLSSSQAQELNVNWVMVTVGCANPGFPYDQGFQDLINSIEHVGRFPWTTEIIRFTTANSGTWQTTYIEDRNNQCELTQDFTWKKDLQNQMKEIEELTKKNTQHTVNFALGYGGRQEIVDAVKKLAKLVLAGKMSPQNITEEEITKQLYLQSEPDIIIRPGGEKRVSSFLIWQGVYSEWFFLEKMWPQVTKNDLKMIVDEFSKRQRRFGE